MRSSEMQRQHCSQAGTFNLPCALFFLRVALPEKLP